jgi:acyl-homoserine lactone acylase PvdQ
MGKRIVAAVLWVLAGWYAGALAVEVASVPWVVAPLLGVTCAVLVAGDPLHRIWTTPRPAPQRSPASADVAAPAPPTA